MEYAVEKTHKILSALNKFTIAMSEETTKK